MPSLGISLGRRSMSRSSQEDQIEKKLLPALGVTYAPDAVVKEHEQPMVNQPDAIGAGTTSGVEATEKKSASVTYDVSWRMGMDQISTVSQTTGVPLSWFLMVSAILFCLGFIGVLTRRNVLVIFMSAELMMNAVNLSLIAFSTSLNSMAGQNFVVFVVTIAAAEAAVGLAIIISLVRQKPTVDTTDIDLMQE
jgi:NADH-quinone oxidoreductase subunit K